MMINYSLIRHLPALTGGIATSLMMFITAWAAPVPTGLPAWQCAGNGTHFFQVTEQTDGPSQAGTIISRFVNNFSAGNAVCNCPGSIQDFSLFSATASLLETDGWLRLNDKLSAQVSAFISGSGFVQVPFFEVQSNFQTSCSSANNSHMSGVTGTVSRIDFRVDRSFLGESHFSGELAKVYWQFPNAIGGPAFNHPFVRINANITVRTTQSCSFRAGDTFTVDLGTTPINQLNAGAPPGLGYIPRPIDLTVDCSDGTDNSLSGLEFFATATGTPDANGPYIATSKPGIGVAMTDASGNLLGLGMENGMIRPLQNDSSQTRLLFYPTLVPGQESQVTPGPYNTAVTITVSIP